MFGQSENLTRFLLPVIEWLVLILNLISILILVIGVAHVVWFLLSKLVQPGKKQDIVRTNNSVKNKLGSYVLLSLEVLIAADIIETIVKPTFKDIMMLGLIVVIRTVISYFLTKEIKESEDN
ncbi:DUF1622 domain-containing protein [Listeria aquatica]|uniref:DUF1622 domain-containing protein n=1 Tax=Listeria aquatica FSL S10-1188 TaxID=1265818 RepID=W7BAY4_9LIST|nr:DUF1622 domain-containing protein [Listeria aquatica]EUJ21845.1 hypothetical protein MAQA_00545 [Listeria aquatica FSL S10-1188]